MSYQYKVERERLFTDAGQRQFIDVRDVVVKLLKCAGAFKSGRALVSGDSWLLLAALDRMVELGELRELTVQGTVAGQDRVFVSTKEELK